MNDEKTQLATVPKPVVTVHDTGPLANLLDTARFEHLQRIASIMGRSSLVPKHLKGATLEETIGNCFRVTNQALRWGFDPFAVADESYVVAGKLGYQGKLVAAVVNARAGLKGRLRPTYTGDGLDRTVKIAGTFEGEDVPCEITLSVRQAKTENKMWTSDPDQKLFYSGVVKWARRYCPEIILGTLTDDDLDNMVESAKSNGIPAEKFLRGPGGETASGRAAEMLNNGGEEPKAEGSILAEIEEQIARLNLTKTEVQAHLKEVGARGLSTLRQSQADRLLSALSELAPTDAVE